MGEYSGSNDLPRLGLRTCAALITLFLVSVSAISGELKISSSSTDAKASFGFFFGNHLFLTEDLGPPLLVVVGFQRWYELRYQEIEGTYHQTYVSPRITEGGTLEGITAAAHGELDGKAPADLLLRLSNGQIVAYDLKTHELITQFDSGIDDSRERPGSIAIRDLNRDGEAEIIVADVDGLYFFDRRGQLLDTVDGPGGPITIGQMDLDDSLEIATSSGHVVDADSKLIQWEYSKYNSGVVISGDFDGDGLDELVSSFPGLVAYDVDLQQVIWSIANPHGTASMALGDIDRDGNLELVVGSAQWDDLFAMDPQSQAVEWVIDNPEYKIRSIAMGDVDSDGESEVIWAPIGMSSSNRGVYIADGPEETIEWNGVHLSSSFIGPVYGDINGDGRGEVVVSTEEGELKVLDPGSMQIRAAFELEPLPPHKYTSSLELFDYDGDGDHEIVVSHGGVQILDYPGELSSGLELLWRSSLSWTFQSIALGDLNGDDIPDVLAGSGRSLFAFDGQSEELLWQTDLDIPLRADLIGLSIFENQVGNPMIMAFSYQKGLYFLDRSGSLIDSIPGEFTASAMRQSLGLEILTAEIGGLVCYRYGQNLRVLLTQPPSCTDLNLQYIRHLTFDRDRRYWLKSGGRVYLYDGLQPLPLWVSEDYGEPHFSDHHDNNPKSRVQFMSEKLGVLSNGEYSVNRFRVLLP